MDLKKVGRRSFRRGVPVRCRLSEVGLARHGEHAANKEFGVTLVRRFHSYTEYVSVYWDGSDVKKAIHYSYLDVELTDGTWVSCPRPKQMEDVT